MENANSIFAKLHAITSQAQVRELFVEQSLEYKHVILTNFIKKLDKAIETYISRGDTQTALWKMSQQVIIEDELMITERLLVKMGVLA